jgi:hypothetical protein
MWATREEFPSGDAEQGAYVCHLTIATPKLTMQPGGPASYVSPAAGEHGSAAASVATVLETAVLRAEELASGLVKKVITPAGELGTEILGVGAATIARAASLTIGLVLTPTNSRDDDGYKSEWDLGKLTQNPTDKDRARLDYLEKEREERALSDVEEDELASLLAVVRKVFVGGRAGLPGYYTQRQSLIALAAKLKRSNDVHSINTIDSKTRFGGGNRNTSKTIAMGQVDLAADFAAIQAGDAVYDKQTQTFLTTSGRVYGYHTDEVGSGNTSAIYPIRSSAEDFVNVTQVEFDILRKMPTNGGLTGSALLELEGKLRAKNGGVTTDTAAKLIKLFNSKKK